MKELVGVVIYPSQTSKIRRTPYSMASLIWPGLAVGAQRLKILAQGSGSVDAVHSATTFRESWLGASAQVKHHLIANRGPLWSAPIVHANLRRVALAGDLLTEIEKAGRLPTPPAVVLQLLTLTRRADVSIREVADTVALDPTLAAKILRFANSPMAGIPRDVTTMHQAVALTGTRGVTMMALSFSVLSPSGREVCDGFDPQRFALYSISCAASARQLAKCTQSVSPQEAFIGGLLSQIGRLMLAMAKPTEYADLLRNVRQVPRDLPQEEAARFGENYATLGAKLLQRWCLPRTLCEAISTFRQSDEIQEAPPLAKVLHVAELAADVICADASAFGDGVVTFVDAAQTLVELPKDKAPELLRTAAEEMESIRTIMDVPAPEHLQSISDLEMEVRERIAELGMAVHLENRSMAKQQEELKRKATTDALTGISNRSAFDVRLQLEVERAARNGSTLGLMMIDVDRFKQLNDTFGHQAGDRALSALARALHDNVRTIDHVARYGGEEFVVVAPETPLDGLLLVAERLRAVVENLAVEWEGNTLRVTVSIGVAVVRDVVDATDATIALKQADAALYSAKES